MSAGLTFFSIVFSWLTMVTVLVGLSFVLYGDLFRDLGVVLRFAASTSRQEEISWHWQMGPDARSSPNHGHCLAVAVDKIHKQPPTGFVLAADGPQLNGCAVGFSPALVGITWCRTTRLLAVNSNHRPHRCCRVVVPRCVRQRHRSHDRVSPGCRSAHTRDATTF